ncbi:MAG TPA: UDP-N-acetylmuramoyl-tripeptide--D-alanyl-D-alanine ligase [Candidatus Polarisedimenticolaceae bacterium]|nr:UDP-N-acetylmuramoyl-tripeptide--D-alanyl-D-alanine ligase [Candidatus Polarisedimenticolaceae bacterium]
MPTLSVEELVEATGGHLVSGDPHVRVASYAIDTRKLAAGGAFFALPGTKTDGHAFLGDAARAGAAAAIVSRVPESGRPFPGALIQVDDVTAALARCGAYARHRVGATVVAITGSAGKTTTKEFVAAGLAAGQRVHRTTGNLNNELGLPLSLLGCPDDAEAAVFEMGMNGPGQIAFLAHLADPDVGLVTNVRPVHLEFFSSIDDIAAAKGELFAVLRDDAISVVNLDDPRVRVQAARHAGPRVTYGRSESADLVLTGLTDRFVPGATVTFRHQGRSYEIALKIGGSHAALDAFAAAAVLVACGAPLDHALEAIARVEPAPGRGRLSHLPGGVIVVDDTYNSNPEALASVLATLAASTPPGRRVLVMGDMLELGPEAPEFHRSSGELAARSGVALVVGVGPLARHAVEAARRAGVDAQGADDAAQAARLVPPLVRPGDLVVVKGSRGVKLELVVEALVARQGEAA